MNRTPNGSSKRFVVELIKPSHYDDDGYVIQWVKAWVPSNSLACLYGLSLDLAERRALGPNVELVVNAYDETNTVVPVRKIIRRLSRPGATGLVCLVGVQSNQFPRALDLARRFRAAGIQVAIGGFHVSGCIAMLPELPPDIREAQDLGVTLYAGETEGRLEEFYLDALHGRMKPLYNNMADLPAMNDQPTPFLPESMVRRYGGAVACFDAGRGCPFQCSFWRTSRGEKPARRPRGRRCDPSPRPRGAGSRRPRRWGPPRNAGACRSAGGTSSAAGSGPCRATAW